MAALAAVALYPASGAERGGLFVPVLGLGAVALLAAGLAGIERAVGLALGLAGTEYVVWLVLDGPRLDAASPLVAAGLALAGELAYRSLDARGPVPPAEGENARRAATAVAVAAAGGAAGLVVLAAGDAAPAGGTALALVAAAAAAAALGLVAALGARTVG